MNELLFNIFEKNKVVFFLFAIVGTISFFAYSFRGDDLESNTFRYVAPVSLWLLAENMAKTAGYIFPEKWNRIAVIVSCLLIVVMVLVSLKKDFTLNAVFNIVGNLFVMYAAPMVLYIALCSVVVFGGGAALILVGVLALAFGAMFLEHRIYD